MTDAELAMRFEVCKETASRCGLTLKAMYTDGIGVLRGVSEIYFAETIHDLLVFLEGYRLGMESKEVKA